MKRGFVFQEKLMKELMRLGRKRLMYIEQIPGTQVDGYVKTFEREGFRITRKSQEYRYNNTNTNAVWEQAGDGELVSLFISREQAIVDEAIELIDSCDSLYENRDEMLRMGELLGYPECCVKAHVDRLPLISPTEYYLAPFMHTKGKFNPLLNPFMAIFCACSGNCAAAVDFIQAGLEDLRNKSPQEVASELSVYGLPYLYFGNDMFFCLDGYVDGNSVRYENVRTSPSVIDHDSFSFLKEFYPKLVEGDMVCAGPSELVVKKRDKIIFVVQRSETLYAPVILDPAGSCITRDKFQKIVFVKFNEHEQFDYSTNHLNVLAGNFKELGGDPVILDYDLSKSIAGGAQFISQLIEAVDYEKPGLVVFQNDFVSGGLIGLRKLGYELLLLGDPAQNRIPDTGPSHAVGSKIKNDRGLESVRNHFDYIISDCSSGKSISFLQALVEGWDVSTSFPTLDPMILGTRGFHPQTNICRPENRIFSLDPDSACGYAHSNYNHDTHKGADTVDRIDTEGCLCCLPGMREYGAGYSLELMLSQMDTCVKNNGFHRFSTSLRLDLLGELVAGIPDRGSLIELCVQARPDAICAHADRLAELVGAAAENNVVVSFHRVCLGNFSHRELNTYSMGITPGHVTGCIEIIDDLALRFPEVFRSRTVPSSRFILFGPWTMHEDLTVNYEYIMNYRVYELVIDIFRSRIRLYRGTPLFRMAKAESLLCGDPDSGTVLSDCGVAEEAWKFKHDSTAKVFELFHDAVPYLSGGTEAELFSAALKDAKNYSAPGYCMEIEKLAPDYPGNIEENRTPCIEQEKHSPKIQNIFDKLSAKVSAGRGIDQLIIESYEWKNENQFSIKLMNPTDGERISISLSDSVNDIGFATINNIKLMIVGDQNSWVTDLEKKAIYEIGKFIVENS